MGAGAWPSGGFPAFAGPPNVHVQHYKRCYAHGLQLYCSQAFFEMGGWMFKKSFIGGLTAVVLAAGALAVPAPVLITEAVAQNAPTAQAVAAQRIAAMRAIINANRNNPAALRAALAAYVAQNPAAAPLVSNALAGQGLPAAALAAVGNAIADARAALIAAGNTAGAAAVAAEAATLPPAAQTAYTTTTTTGTTQPIVAAAGAPPATDTNTGGGTPPAAQSLPGGTGGGSGSSNSNG
jgi:hypothetical protein